MQVIYCGNFVPPHSTENHLAIALEANGHRVVRLQENEFDTFGRMSDIETWPTRPDFILWTRTGWDWTSVFGERGEFVAHALQRGMLTTAKAANIPVVGYHLDIFHRLQREHITTEPFFKSDLVITADGSADEKWEQAGINHLWFMPGVSRDECQLGTPRAEYRSKLAFVGSWQGSYHQEHQHRFELVAWLKKNFRRDCAFWPQPGQHAVRGKDLRDLYASVDVAVGDSCFSGDGIGLYSSDRIPESLGRGALLLHPRTPGVTDGSDTPVGPSWVEGKHLACWDAGDWDGLGATIEALLADQSARQEIAAAGRAFTLAGHTYGTRMQQMVDAMETRGLL